MIKYHMIINIKNDNYVPPERWFPEMDKMNKKEYYISFKCFGDSMEHCIDQLFEQFRPIIMRYGISSEQIENDASFSKINTEKLPRYEELFLIASNI